MTIGALLLVSFGGPNGPADVIPFLENVLRGRPVPRERLLDVAEHYHRFGGVSPINGLNLQLKADLEGELARRRSRWPVYWGNRNWEPYLADALREMRAAGIGRAAAFVTSAYSSYSSCRQYLEDIERARAEVGEGAPEIIKIGPFYDHPGFVGPLAEGLAAARAEAGPGAAVLMSAHSIPEGQAANCDYAAQLRTAGDLVAAGAGERDWTLVYQSRSGPPSQPWLGPDVGDAIDGLPAGMDSVIVVPLGFVSDHMEVVYDLDHQAAQRAEARGLRLIRTPTPGTHPDFVRMVADLAEKVDRTGQPACPCTRGCLPPARPAPPARTAPPAPPARR